ncbi:MAG: ATP-grasp domain-containing protein [Planctomycetes bacterium]|nr:ATP-grasp domain-containing protein [Planctomycetota bacterium]
MALRVLLLSDTPAFGQSVLRCLGVAGVQTHVWCTQRFSPMRLSRYCRRYHYVPRAELLDTSAAAVERLNRACRTHGLDAILPTDMPTAYTLATLQGQLTPRLGVFPLPDRETLERFDDKWRFSQYLSEQGVPQPETRLLRRPEDLQGLDLAYPVIVKPPIGDGGRGVVRVDSAEELAAGLSRGEHALPLLVQRFIPGHDVDLSLLADRGRLVAYTIQEAIGAKDWRRFLEDPEIVEAGRKIVEGCGFHGVMHLDMMREARGGSLAVIECNPRFWGSIELSLWAGVNFPVLGLRLLQGRDVGFRQASHLGECQATGISVRRMARALLRGRLAPPELGPASRASWFQNLADPLPELAASLARRWRRP